ncbi:hypothetical protein, partial [Granulicella sp. S190]|uniref:hypothetical protein n=1 Tax=Granulicella sp. S190 TaxID=1747226 RepID=UPI001C2077BA
FPTSALGEVPCTLSQAIVERGVERVDRSFDVEVCVYVDVYVGSRFTLSDGLLQDLVHEA